MLASPLAVFTLLPWPDWLALIAFFAGWIGYAVWARRRSTVRPSVLAASNAERRRWMLQATWRENRVIDGIVVQSMSTSPSFFASTTILIIGGLLAVLSTTEKASELVQQMPFAARTSVLVFDLKLVLLTGIFVYAFFRFTWSLRQYTFGALLVASAPDHLQFEQQPPRAREAFADRAGRVVGLAAETFNDGLRAYYMAFAAIGWFFSPLAFACATAGVIWILYQREFRSEVLALLTINEAAARDATPATASTSLAPPAADGAALAPPVADGAALAATTTHAPSQPGDRAPSAPR